MQNLILIDVGHGLFARRRFILIFIFLLHRLSLYHFELVLAHAHSIFGGRSQVDVKTVLSIFASHRLIQAEKWLLLMRLVLILDLGLGVSPAALHVRIVYSSLSRAITAFRTSLLLLFLFYLDFLCECLNFILFFIFILLVTLLRLLQVDVAEPLARLQVN